MGDGLSKQIKDAQREADKEAEKYPEEVRERYRPIVTIVVETKVVTSKPPIIMEDEESGLESEETPTKKRKNSAEKGTSSPKIKKQKMDFKASPRKGTRTGLRSETNTNRLSSECEHEIKCTEIDQCLEVTVNNMKEFGILEKWPAQEVPEKVIGVIPVDGVLTYIVKKKLSYELDYISVLNTIVVNAADFRSKFPQLVIKYYQGIVSWSSDTTPICTIQKPFRHSGCN